LQRYVIKYTIKSNNLQGEKQVDIYVGIDILEFNRFQKVLKKRRDRFLDRVYTDKEVANTPKLKEELFLCFTFSFKESIWKALPDYLQKEVGFKDIEIIWRRRKPQIFIKGKHYFKTVSHFFEMDGNVVTLVIITV